MASFKRRARGKATGKFIAGEATIVADGDTILEPPETMPKKKVGRPRKKPEREKDTFDLSVTVSIGGGDVPVCLLENIHSFLVKECLAGKCSLERGGAAYHLHFQMIVRIQAINVISVSRLLKLTANEDEKIFANTESMADILVHTPAKLRSAATIDEISRKGKQKVNASPTRRLWPEEWKIDELCAAQRSSESDSDSASLAGYKSAHAFGEYAPVYKRPKMGIVIA